jgi:hypothetical protein
MNTDKKQLVILIGMFILAIILWDTVFIYPIKLFVVMLHEISHGLMAELLGGDIIKIEINSMIGGSCTYSSAPGFMPSLMITSAGYLGSLLWGVLIFLIASHTNYDRYLSAFIGIVSLLITYFVIQSGELFGVIFCVVFSLFMLVSARYLPLIFQEYFLKFMGLTSCLYVILDIKSDLINQSGIGSDADQIAQMTGIPSVFIGVIWIITALIIVYFMLKKSILIKGKKTE